MHVLYYTVFQRIMYVLSLYYRQLDIAQQSFSYFLTINDKSYS